MRRFVLLVAGLTVLLASVAVASSGSGTRVEARWVITDLPTPGGKASYAADINDRGQIVGLAHIRESVQHAFLWENDTMRDLGTLGGAESDAKAINEHGQVVGSADTKVKHKRGFEMHAFLWEKGKMRDLGTLGGPHSEAVAINERGQIVGWSDTWGAKFKSRAVLWTLKRG